MFYLIYPCIYRCIYRFFPFPFPSLSPLDWAAFMCESVLEEGPVTGAPMVRPVGSATPIITGVPMVRPVASSTPIHAPPSIPAGRIRAATERILDRTTQPALRRIVIPTSSLRRRPIHPTDSLLAENTWNKVIRHGHGGHEHRHECLHRAGEIERGENCYVNSLFTFHFQLKIFDSNPLAVTADTTADTDTDTNVASGGVDYVDYDVEDSTTMNYR